MTVQAEAEYVTRQIERLAGGISLFSQDSGRIDNGTFLDEKWSFGDIAILYRMNSQSKALTAALERSGIPCRNLGDSSLINEPVVRDMVALLQWSEGLPVATGPALRCLSLTIDGLGKQTLELLEKRWEQRNQITVSHVRELVDQPHLLMRRTRESLQSLIQTIEDLKPDQPAIKPATMLKRFADTEVFQKLQLRYPQVDAKLKALVRLARMETTVASLLDKLLLCQENDACFTWA